MNEQKSDARRGAEAEQLQHLKTTILKQWHGLPPRERATLLFELLHDVLESDVGQSVRRELGLGSAVETVNPVDEAVPTNWVHKRVYQGLWYTVRSKTKGANRNVTLCKRTR